MAWVKIPPEYHPLFLEALPKDRRVERIKMFGGIAAKANGYLFAALFGRSVMLLLDEPNRAEALRLEGASRFDPMGHGRAHGDKIILPERMMDEADELRSWIECAFQAALARPPKVRHPAKRARPAGKRESTRRP